MFCSRCGSQIPDGSQTCPSCGADLQPRLPQKKFCKFCGAQIDYRSVVCPSCGGQVEMFRSQPQPGYQPQPVYQPAPQATPIIINNVATAAVPVYYGRPVDKWVAFLLCFFLGFIGAHKFYEGKTGMGILYIFTLGLFGIGWLIDTLIILFKPNPYYVL